MNPINISIVKQGQVYRGPQPYTPAQWQYLKDLGIRTVLKLNFDVEDVDEPPAGIALFKCAMYPRDVWQAMEPPEPRMVAKAVEVLADAELYPIYVHCTHGHDRTGLVIGEWRVLHCGWPCEQAFQEMMEYGFHPELPNLLWTWHQFVESRETKMKKLPMGRRPVHHTLASFMRSHIMVRALNALGTPPEKSPDWVSAVMKQSSGGWLMDGNDQYGDCVVADCAHQEMLRTANVGTIWIPNILNVLGLYAMFQGYRGNPSNLKLIEQYLDTNDNGCNELDVITYLTKTGWLGRKLDGSANLDPTQMDQIKWAVCIFGASRLGLNLPDSAQAQFASNQPWDYVPGAQLDGGHDVPVVQYGAGLYGVITWGKLQPVTEAFMTAKYPDGTPYVEEAHAELAFDWVNAAGTCPDNLNLAQLVADLNAIVEPVQPPQPTPVPVPPGPPPTPPNMSKAEFFKLVAMADATDFQDQKMTVQDMANDIARICGMIK